MTTADFRRYALRQVIDRNSLLAEVQQMEERMARQQVRLAKANDANAFGLAISVCSY